MTDSLNADLARLSDHAETGDTAALLEAAREIITEQRAELESYRDGVAPENLEAESQLADTLRALSHALDWINCARPYLAKTYPHRQQDIEKFIGNCNAILEESQGDMCQ